MSYQHTFSVRLGPIYAGLTLAAQLIDTAGDDVGSEIDSGFVEVGGGDYMLTATIPDDHAGGIVIYEDGAPSAVLAFGEINAAGLDALLGEILEDTGTTLPALIAGVGAGSGTGYYSDTVESPAGTPVDGARVSLATDDIGDQVAYQAYTNALGVFVMRPDPGTYYRFIELAGHTFTEGVAVEVEEA